MANEVILTKRNTFSSEVPDYEMKLNIDSVGRNTGVEWFDMPVTTVRDLRVMFPASGLKDDLNFDFYIFEEDVNMCKINGIEVPSKTIVEQYNFFFENIVTAEGGQSHDIYIPYLDRKFNGRIKTNGKIESRNYSGFLFINLTFFIVSTEPGEI